MAAHESALFDHWMWVFGRGIAWPQPTTAYDMLRLMHVRCPHYCSTSTSVEQQMTTHLEQTCPS